MAIIIGSARHDENGKIVGGKAGDSLQKSSTNDTVGEVSMQPMYTSTKGWYILRPKSIEHADAMAAGMKKACNNKNIGYDQGNRLAILKDGIASKRPIECDCSSLVREVIKKSSGKDPGNFTTADEADTLERTGLFEKRKAYVSQAKTPVYNGDVLVTKTKGHTAIVVSGNPRKKKTAASSDGNLKKATESAKSYDRKLSGTYRVTAYSLNVRNGAGKDKGVMVTIPKGTSVNCFGYYTEVSETKWLYVQFTYKNVAYIGFCSSEHLEK